MMMEECSWVASSQIEQSLGPPERRIGLTFLVVQILRTARLWRHLEMHRPAQLEFPSTTTACWARGSSRSNPVGMSDLSPQGQRNPAHQRAVLRQHPGSAAPPQLSET